MVVIVAVGSGNGVSVGVGWGAVGVDASVGSSVAVNVGSGEAVKVGVGEDSGSVPCVCCPTETTPVASGPGGGEAVWSPPFLGNNIEDANTITSPHVNTNAATPPAAQTQIGIQPPLRSVT